MLLQAEIDSSLQATRLASRRVTPRDAASRPSHPDGARAVNEPVVDPSSRGARCDDCGAVAPPYTRVVLTLSVEAPRARRSLRTTEYYCRACMARLDDDFGAERPPG